ncbi:uroporphyrinogen-III synthase HemD family protein [Anaplasma phagocytophilum str. ApMUC09]|uniref:Uroporphyrinogen-III synthase n=1 Tax=Anaplasma phagocytophilum str. ApMUC09 TaxID=1359152 RepID=A0A0F3NBA2_ANAPH|nr:uroporphyrinogen-III synthase HemD family protein [Anaplasma phagocytophilum str. ApMUC09]SCV65116.1 uroporphyrinogen-III synthase [Anaplasma phagocytophilum]
MLLLTRAMCDSVKSRDALIAMGFDVFIEPMFEVRYLAAEITGLEGYEVVLATSRHGITGMAQATDNRSIPIITVGDSSMKHALSLGFQNVKTVSGTAEDLLHYLRTKSYSSKVLYIRGTNISHDLSKMARNFGITVEELILYETIRSTKLSPECCYLLSKRKISGVLFYSMETAKIFMNLVEKKYKECLATVAAYTISSRVCDALNTCKWKGVFVSESPTEESLFRLLLK